MLLLDDVGLDPLGVDSSCVVECMDELVVLFVIQVPEESRDVLTSSRTLLGEETPPWTLSNC